MFYEATARSIAVILLLCSFVHTSARADTINPLSWTTDTINDASASVVSNDVALRVFKTSSSSASANLGNLYGTLNISYDFSVTATGWYEGPGASVTNNGSSPFQLSSCSASVAFPSGFPTGCGHVIQDSNSPLRNITPVAYGTATGSISTSLSVNGQTGLNFYIYPSWSSGAGDHSNTYFNITNLSLSYTAAGAAPEIDGALIPQVGFLLAALFLMFGRNREISICDQHQIS